MNNLFSLLMFLCLFSVGWGSEDVGSVSIPEIEQRVNAYPNNLKLRYVLSRAYAQKGASDPRFYDKSISQLEEIMRTRQIAVVKFYLGLMYARKGDIDTAIYHWLTIVRSMKPNNMTTLRYLALAFERKKKHSESLEYWARILSLNPEDYKAHFHAALVTLRDLSVEPNIRFARAANHFQKVLGKFPNHRKSLWYLSLTYGNSRQYLKQRQVLQKLVVLMPNNPRILRELQQNADNLKTQPQDAVLSIRPEDLQIRPAAKEPEPARQPEQTKAPIRVVSVAMEISDDEFAAAFGRDPEPNEVPVEHRPEPVAINPTLPIDSPLSADAELLFNQGVTYMNNGEYDMALFHFLQAQELDPKFAQCYLQIGEVYFKLADATPTEEKFKEHLKLARQSLETAKQLEPDSLLAHASNAKMIQVEKKLQDGFEKAHLDVARSAIRSQNFRFAAEEFIILLTNGFSSVELMFLMADLVPNLEDGSLLDLGNVLETFVSEKKLAGYYLLSKILRKMDPERSWKLLDELFTVPGREVAFFDGLRKRAESSQTDFMDEYLLGRYLLENQAYGPASSWLEKAMQKADSESSKWIESWLAKAKSEPSRAQRPALTAIPLPTGEGRRPFELYERQKAELIALNPDFQTIFAQTPSWGDVQIKRDILEGFLKQSPQNRLAQYLLGCILLQSSLDNLRDQGETLKASLLDTSVSASELDSDWYFMAGLLAQKLKDSFYSEKYFDRSLYGLLYKGFEIYSPYAAVLVTESNKAMEQNDWQAANNLLRQGFLYDPYHAGLAANKVRVLEKSAPNETFSFARTFLQSLLSEEIYWEILKADVGNTAFWAVFMALLIFSAAIVIKCKGELKHLMDELMGERSLSVPITTFVGLGLLVFFPTGLIAFLPIVLWGFLSDLEKLIYIVGIVILILMPVIFPVGYANNLEHLRALHLMQQGEFLKAKTIYQDRLSTNPLDIDARFQMALIENAIGKGSKTAISMWESIVSERPDHFAALGNLGVAYAQTGDYDKAQRYLQSAFNLDPIDDRVLFNLARVYELRGQQTLADNHLKWIGGSGEKSRKNIDRYLSFVTQSLPLFAYFPLKGAMSSHNTWFASVSESKLSMSLLFFLGWFVMGGGMVGILFFLKDKMDVVVTHCRFCDTKICNNCQSTLNNQPLCSACFESEGRRRKGIHYFRHQEQYHKEQQAKLLNYLLPGAALTVQDRPILGLFISCVFLSSLFWFVTGGGTLWNSLFLVENTILTVILWCSLLVSITSYALSQIIPGFQRPSRTLL
ncbi:MAG: tetratricopeptide repeat protein [Candidatus Cloacimonetes bacterium]|nr:tetratricopeptide repeat protein [Candidatus Cloacimonadota bacterium]